MRDSGPLVLRGNSPTKVRLHMEEPAGMGCFPLHCRWRGWLPHAGPTGHPGREEAARERGLGAEASALSGPGGRKRALDRLFQQALIPLPSLVLFGATCSSGRIQGLVRCQPRPAVNTEFVPCICGLRGTFIKYNLPILHMGTEAWVGVGSPLPGAQLSRA